MLCPTPRELLLDGQGRPTFLWDCEVTWPELEDLLASPELPVRAYWVGKVMRQAKPDDALTLVRPEEMRALWPEVERYLGDRRAFWAWLLERLAGAGDGER